MKQFISLVAGVFSNSPHSFIALAGAIIFLATGSYLHTQWVASKKDDWIAAQTKTPLLILADTNLDRLDQAITYLLEVRDSFAKEPYYTHEEANMLRSALHPEIFLRSLVPLEKARRTFSHTPTPETARIYHHALLYSLSAYRDDIQKLDTALSHIPEGTYAFPRGTTSVTHVQTALVSIDSQARVAQRTLAARRLCGNGLVRTACPAQSVFDSFTPTPVTKDSDKKTMSFLRELYENDSRIYSRFTIPFYSQCDNRRVGGNAPLLVTYVIPPERPTLLARKTHGTSDAYFRDFTTQGSSTVVTALRRNGYEYEHQASGHHYLCPDAGLDALNLTRAMLYEHGSRNALQLAHASYELDSVIAEIGLENTFATRMARYGAPLSLTSLFLSRSGASTLFLLGNTTLIPNAPSLFESTTTYPLENFGLNSVAETPAQKLPKIMRGLQESRERYETSIFNEETTPFPQGSPSRE
jgi:hypothetical protein